MIDQQRHTNVEGPCSRSPQGHYTLLLEKYSVSEKWVVIMYRRQASNATSTPAGKSGPSAQDRYCSGDLRRGAKKRRGNGE